MKRLFFGCVISVCIIIQSLLFYYSDVCAKGEVYTQSDTTDVVQIELVNAGSMPKIDGLWEIDAPGYYFTKKSAGKYIPVTSPVNGSVFYYPEEVYFMDTNRKEVKSTYTFHTEGTEYDIFSVEKNKTYFVYIPNDIHNARINMFVYPDNVKNIKMNTTYFQTGTGKNTYKYFTLKKMSLIDVRVIHASFKGKNTTYYLQKKVKGKWKTITEKRSVIADEHAEVTYYRAPYGLSRGKYRLVTKTVKNGKYWVYLETKKCVNHGKSSKRKAKRIKYGTDVQGIFTYGDKKVHWYKLKADRDIRLTFRTSMEPHGVTFTIYKKEKKQPVKTINLKGKSGRKDWEEEYKRSKKYTLEDGDGWYYIKVTRKHAKANGWYVIEN